jgi:hypothetical protein
MLGVIIFGSVRFYQKIVTKPKFKKKTETGSNRPVSVRFGSVFLGQKPVQTVLARFFRFGSVFFPVFFGSVRFGFFKILIGLIGFFLFSFFGYFFLFSRFNRFFGFFGHP